MLAAASAAVAQLVAPRFLSVEPTLLKKLSASCGAPSTLPSCPAAMSRPVPALNPIRVGAEMKSARKLPESRS